MKDQKDTAAGDPEATAIAALGWLAEEPELLSRFLALTGIEPADLRHAAGDPAFLAGVLDFLMGHEPTLMRFTEASGIAPEAVVRAHAKLGGPPADHGW
jgi:hypothetical protein